MQQSQQSFSPSFIGEYGAEGFSGQGFSYGASFRGDQNQSLGPGQAPGIGFTPSPGSGPSGPPNTNFNNIHIPPGAHAPANTPAELPPPTGTQHSLYWCNAFTCRTQLDVSPLVLSKVKYGHVQLPEALGQSPELTGQLI